MSGRPRPGIGGSDQTRRQTSYTAGLLQLSKTPLQPELYSRVQYQVLARYLSTASAHSQHSQRGDPAGASQGSDAFIHVVVHTFSGSSKVRHVRDDFNLKDGLARFENHAQPQDHAEQIVFVRGSLSAAWIEALGIKYKIDPEFFRRHLRYLPGRQYSDLPSLPSANTDMMTLRFATLYTRPHTIAKGQIRSWRDKDSDVARRNQKSIFAEMASAETVIRRFSTLSDRLFSVEHEIAIFTRSRKNGGQIAVVLLDNGLEMNRKDGPPCFSEQDSIKSGASITGISQIPVIIPRPPSVNINVVHPEIPMHYDPAPPGSIGHVASLLPFYLGISTNAPSTTQDVLALICEVFRLVAGSQCQFFNQLRDLVQDQELAPANGEDMNLAVSTLRYIKMLSEDHEQYLKQNIAFLETRCQADLDAGSPLVSGSSAQAWRAQPPDGLKSILVDFKELLTHAESLGALCTETAGLILNSAMLDESRKAIQRADDQRRLTVLAYLFLPLSLICSLFGMNVKEFETGSQSIWLPFALLVPVGCISWMLFSPEKTRRVLQIGKLFQSPDPRCDYPIEQLQ